MTGTALKRRLLCVVAAVSLPMVFPSSTAAVPIPDLLPIAQALEKADCIVIGRIFPAETAEEVEAAAHGILIPVNGWKTIAFWFAPDAVIVGELPCTEPMKFELTHFPWPSDLVPYTDGERAMLLLKRGKPVDVLTVLPPLPSIPTDTTKAALKPLIVDLVFSHLLAKPTALHSLPTIRAELSAAQLERLRSDDRNSYIDDELDDRDTEQVERLAERGRFQDAEVLANRLRQSWRRENALGSIADRRLTAGQFAEARRLIDRLSAHSQLLFLESLVRGLERADPVEAQRTAAHLLTVYQQMPPDEQPARADTVARFLATRGSEVEAQEVLHTAARQGGSAAASVASSQLALGFVQDGLETVLAMDAFNQVIHLSQGADYLARHGRLDEAIRFLAAARDASSRIEPSQRLHYLKIIDKAQAEVDKLKP